MIHPVLLAFVVDLIVGDPVFFPHPVALIARAVSWLESKLRKRASKPSAQMLGGGLLWFVVVSGSYLVTHTLISLAARHSVLASYALEVWLISTTVAVRGLLKAGLRVKSFIESGDLKASRRAVAEIVGRDTQNMSQTQVMRAMLESVAENSVDGIIAPLFYAALGGAPLAMAYRAINTMDSMLGHKDAHNLHFGRPSAKLDDLANFIPARLTGAAMCVAAFVLRLDAKAAVSAWVCDARKHPSPNAGIPEACAAGALGIRLGGLNYYRGIPEMRAYMGSGRTELRTSDADALFKMVILASCLVLFVLVLI
jgi:adenosylcobinamide-phosphate synthase